MEVFSKQLFTKTKCEGLTHKLITAKNPKERNESQFVRIVSAHKAKKSSNA